MKTGNRILATLLLSMVCTVIFADDFSDGDAAQSARNLPVAIEKFKRGASNGDARSQFRLGLMYATGVGVNIDYKEAARLYGLAADQGHEMAKDFLARLVGKGWVTDSRYLNDALEILKRDAKKGDLFAQINLFGMYYEGRGVARDYGEAFKWANLYAQSGLAAGQYRVALMYYKGQGVVQDYAEAMQWFKLAAIQGDAASQTALGGMYFNGQGVVQDNLKAHVWYNFAAAQGNSNAIDLRDAIEKSMSRQQVLDAQKMARICQSKSMKNCE